MDIANDFKIYEPYYSSFMDEVFGFVSEITKQHEATVDVYRVEKRLKVVSSVEGKLKRLSRSVAKLSDLQDIAGVRIICHCVSDLERLDAILSEELKNRFTKITRRDRDKKNGYRGVHYVIEKNFNINTVEECLLCEVQIRTVLQDAWAIQSHEYGYKKKTEGDADVLKQVVSGILDNCENLWELVKKSVKGGENISGGETGLIYQDISEQIDAIDVASKTENLEKLVSKNKIIEIEDALDIELENITKVWETGYSSVVSPEGAIVLLDDMEAAMSILVSVAILSIKHDRISILQKVLDKFGQVASLANGKDGLIVKLSVPAASIHNAFYYLGIYAISKLKGDAVHLLLSYKPEREYNSRLFFSRIWESGSIMAPDGIRGADKMFDHLRDAFAKDENIRNVLNVKDSETFLDIACQFNMLYCLVAASEKESGMGEPWVYPNFGRFYSARVSKFIERIKHRDDYKKFIEVSLGENFEVFRDKFNGRIKALASRGVGSGYFWQSIESWEGR